MIGSHKYANPDAKVDLFTRKEQPDRFKNEVDIYSEILPGVKDYGHALYSTMLTLDSGKLGQMLIKALQKKRNVRVITNAEVVDYTVQKPGNLVTAVKLANGSIVACDVLVMCQGSWAPFHIYKTLGELVPMIQGQGYIIDVLYDDEKQHKGDHLYLGNSCYSIN